MKISTLFSFRYLAWLIYTIIYIPIILEMIINSTNKDRNKTIVIFSASYFLLIIISLNLYLFT